MLPLASLDMRMKNMSTDYLCDCPCCGGRAEIEQDEFGVMVRCTDCGLNTGGEYATRGCGTEEEAIEKWNKRITVRWSPHDAELSRGRRPSA